MIFAVVADCGYGGDDGGGAYAEGFEEGGVGMGGQDFVDGDGTHFQLKFHVAEES